jgi:hypothetical protein
VNITGKDAGQRVMDLTSPLAIAGIPIAVFSVVLSHILVDSKLPQRGRCRSGHFHIFPERKKDMSRKHLNFYLKIKE